MRLSKREKRALLALLQSPVPRESLDNISGCSNSPDLIMNLRRKGASIPCQRTAEKDRDGNVCRPGVYSLTSEDRAIVQGWLEQDNRPT